MKPFNSKDPSTIDGRKNFAMSICEGVVHITGGLDSKGKTIADFWSYATRLRRWEKL